MYKKQLIASFVIAPVVMQLTAMEQKNQLPPTLISLCCSVLEEKFTYCDYSKTAAIHDLKHVAPLANPAKKQLVQALLRRIPEQPIHLFTLPRVCFQAKFSPTGDTIAIKEKQGVSLWDANTGEAKGLITGNNIEQFTFSSQGTYLIAQTKRTAHVFDVKTLKYLFEVRNVECMLCSPDDTKLIVGKEDSLDWYKLPSGELIKSKAGATPWVLSCNNQQVAYKQRWLLTIEILDHTGPKEPVVFSGIAAAFSPPGDYHVAGVSLTILLAVAETAGKIILYDAATFKPLINFVVPATPHYSLAFSKDGKRLFIQSGKNYSIWDCTTGIPLCYLDRNLGERSEVTLHPEAHYALIEQGNALSIKPFNQKATLLAIITKCIYPRMSPDGSTFLIEGFDNKASLFSVEKRQLIGTFTDAWQTILEAHAVYSPDGKKLMISPDDRCTHVWHLHPLNADEISLQEALALLFLKRYHSIDKRICARAYEILHKTNNQNLKKFVLSYYP